jgi:hypothetical protein
MSVRKTDVFWMTILFAIIIAVVIFAARATRDEQDACEERGGTIVHVHNSQHGEWFCQEPHP